MQQTTNHL